MNKRRLLRYIIAGFIIVASIASLIYYNYLSTYFNNSLESQIAKFGYIGVMLFVFFLELIPQPFLSALVPFTTGLLFGLDWYYLIPIMIIAAISANYLAYFLGYKYGNSIVGIIVSEKKYFKSIKWFKKYGKKAITFLALTPLPYLPVVGGIFKMTFLEFTYYGIFPRLIHFAVFSLIILYFVK